MIRTTLAYIASGVLIIGLMLWIAVSTKPTEQKYDCRMATYPLAVDVPQTVINQCRKLNK
jgi:hypothetical protein